VVRSWEEFVQTFGPPLPISRSFLGYTVRGFFENGGRDAWIGRTLGDSAAVAAATVSTDLSEQQLFVRAQSPGAWGNELRVKIGAGTRGGLRLEVFDTPDSPERADPAVDEQPAEDFDNLAYESDWEQFIEKVNRRSTRVTLSWLRADLSASKPLFGQVVLAGGADGYFMNVSGYLAATDDASHPFALRALDDLSETAILCVPDSVHPDMPPADRQQIEQAAVSHCERHSRIVLLTTAAGEHSLERLRPLVDSASAVIYYPWLRVAHTNASDEIVIPPVGHVAGLLARNDFERGVHIQPSGLPLLGTVSGGGKGAGGLDRQASSADQRLIPRLGINPIHTDPSTDQPCVSTALTTAVPEELHALNRQRFNNYIIRSLRLGLMWTYFEPNDEDVAQRVKEQVSLFFERLLQRGALSGKDPKEAFWVDVERRDDHLLLAFGMAASVESVPGTWRNIALSLPLDQ
jgi:hypothetical protein